MTVSGRLPLRATFRVHRDRWALAFALLFLLVPTSTLHAGLFHPERHHECGNPHDSTRPNACDDTPFAHHDDSCGLCLASKRWAAVEVSIERVGSASVATPVVASPCDVLVALFPRGASGPRAPPLRD